MFQLFFLTCFDFIYQDKLQQVKTVFTIPTRHITSPQARQDVIEKCGLHRETTDATQIRHDTREETKQWLHEGNVSESKQRGQCKDYRDLGNDGKGGDDDEGRSTVQGGDMGWSRFNETTEPLPMDGVRACNLCSRISASHPIIPPYPSQRWMW